MGKKPIVSVTYENERISIKKLYKYSVSFSFFVVRHFRLSLLNNFYCNILHLYNIVIPIINSATSVNLKKTGMASRIL